jgi:hypothetical protein
MTSPRYRRENGYNVTVSQNGLQPLQQVKPAPVHEQLDVGSQVPLLVKYHVSELVTAFLAELLQKITDGVTRQLDG